jgi:hypothetical protein
MNFGANRSSLRSSTEVGVVEADDDDFGFFVLAVFLDISEGRGGE